MTFKVGDRVRVYGLRKRTNGSPYGCVIDEFVGTVRFIGDVLEVEIDGCSFMVHPKQCRKLRPKRVAREFWIRLEPKVILAYPPPTYTDQYIRVREVL